MGNGIGRSALRAATLAFALIVAACAKPAPPPPAPSGPAYIFYFSDAAGVHRLDARSGRDSLLLTAAKGSVVGAVSPDKSLLAVGYTAPDSSRLVVVDAVTGSIRRMHASTRGFAYSLAWSPDGARLAAGYFTRRRVGQQMVLDKGAIVVASLDGRLAPIGCETSKIVYAWVPADTIIVGDGRDLFPVDAKGCRGDASIRLQGKRNVTFSPDGRRLFYYTTAQVRRGSRTVAAAELHIANSNGSNARRIIGDPYDPQHARWSPDGGRLAFDVRPPDAPSLRYIAVFEIAQSRVRFFPSQTAAGTPRDVNPFWAPGGTALVHDRTIGGKTEKILRVLALDPTVVQVEPTVLESDGPPGAPWGWVGDSQLVVVSDRGAKLISMSGALTYTLPGGKTILHVVQAPR